jgi:hypothetical protein
MAARKEFLGDPKVWLDISAGAESENSDVEGRDSGIVCGARSPKGVIN